MAACLPPKNEDQPIVKHVFDWLKEKYGGKYNGCVPRNYLCLDVETTGAKKNEDLIVQIGHCYVEDAVPQFYEDVIINWFEFDDEIVPNWWLEERLNLCRWSMEQKGNFHGVTIERMREQGRPLAEVIDYCTSLYTECRDKDFVFVGHRGLYCDFPPIAKLFDEFGGIKWEWKDDEILDTGALEKAAVTGILPEPGKTVEEYLKRVMNERRSKTKYGLDHCIEKYKILERYEIDMRDRHTAGFDALIVHYLMEEYRGLNGC
jgi:hypothetical protein